MKRIHFLIDRYLLKREMKKGMAIVLCLLLFSACRPGTLSHRGQKADVSEILSDSAHVTLRYAKNFTVHYLSDGTRLVDISVTGHKGKSTYRLALIPRGIKPAVIPHGYEHRIEVPIQRCIPMSTEQLAAFIQLHALDQVCAITNVRHLQNKDVKHRIAKGEIAKIGYEGNFDTETVMALQPDAILVSPFKKGGYEALQQVGSPLIPYTAFKEPTPLGQAEWVKLVGMLTGREKQANAFFQQVEQHYHAYQAVAAKATHRPTIFSGEQKGGQWFVMGGKSYLAQLLRDAGAVYLPQHDHHTGGFPSDFESMYAMAAQADYWRVMNSYPGTFSYQALKAEDQRNEQFLAFQRHHVIYCNIASSGYHELAPLRPDWLLADFIKAIHPELLPTYHPHFYKLL